MRTKVKTEEHTFGDWTVRISKWSDGDERATLYYCGGTMAYTQSQPTNGLSARDMLPALVEEAEYNAWRDEYFNL